MIICWHCWQCDCQQTFTFYSSLSMLWDRHGLMLDLTCVSISAVRLTYKSKSILWLHMFGTCSGQLYYHHRLLLLVPSLVIVKSEPSALFLKWWSCKDEHVLLLLNYERENAESPYRIFVLIVLVRTASIASSSLTCFVGFCSIGGFILSIWNFHQYPVSKRLHSSKVDSKLFATLKFAASYL